jgi:hypothetical protein
MFTNHVCHDVVVVLEVVLCSAQSQNLETVLYSIAGYQYIVVLILPNTYHHLINVLQSEMLFWCEVIESGSLFNLVMGLTY